MRVEFPCPLHRTPTSAGIRALALLFCAGCAPKPVEGPLRLAGWVEADMVKIVPLMGGRITVLNVEEGALVKEGDVLAQLECPELELQLKQAEAALKGAQSQLALIEKGARQEDRQQARELLRQAEIGLQVAQRDYDRAKPLVAAQTLTQKQLDDLASRVEAAQAQVAAASQQYAKIMAGARPEEKKVVAASVEQAEVMIALTKQRLTYCTVRAPITGRVIHKLFERGEVAAPGAPLGVVSDLSTVKVQAFVPEGDLGQLTLGGEATVYVDSHPDKPLPAKITFIASEAEFTPKNIQTQNERVKMLYRFHVRVDNRDELLKSGMPADIILAKCP